MNRFNEQFSWFSWLSCSQFSCVSFPTWSNHTITPPCSKELTLAACYNLSGALALQVATHVSMSERGIRVCRWRHHRLSGSRSSNKLWWLLTVKLKLFKTKCIAETREMYAGSTPPSSCSEIMNCALHLVGKDLEVYVCVTEISFAPTREVV